MAVRAAAVAGRRSVERRCRATLASAGTGNSGAGTVDTGTRPTVSVVIPTLNEARNLPHVLPRLPDDVSEVIIVDGRSTDGTPEVALALRPDVRIVRERRRGKGSALEHGFRAATGDIIVMLDADGSADPAEIPRFVEALEGGADFAKGSRNLAGGGSTDITRLRSWGNRALTAVVNMLYGTRYTDLCYGYNAVWARCLPHIDFHCRGFEVETLINIRVAKSALRVREVPSLEHPRIHGVSNLNAASDGWRVLRTIVAERFHRSGRVSPGVGRDVPRVPSGRTVDD